MVPVGHWQTPLTQVPPSGQVKKQPPQWVLSVRVFVQMVLHNSKPSRHISSDSLQEIIPTKNKSPIKKIDFFMVRNLI